jgi:hypothetical protein
VHVVASSSKDGPKKITQAELARRKGVSEAAVSQAAKRGRITKAPDGTFDPALPENAAYLSTSKRQQRQVHRKPGGKPGVKPAQRVVRSGGKRKPRGKKLAAVPDGGGPLEIDGETYGMAELRKIVAQADKEEQQNAIRRGELVERTDVHRVFAHLYAVHSSQLKTLADKLGPDIAAAFKLTDADTPRVQELMGLEVRRSLAQIKTELNAFLDQIGDGDIDTKLLPSPAATKRAKRKPAKQRKHRPAKRAKRKKK